MKRFLTIIILIALLSFSCNDYPPLEENEVATLPIIFHIVHRGESVGFGDNLSAPKIYQYYDLLNHNFRDGIGSVDIKIQFKLAIKDPNGHMLTEPGIHRIYDPSYSSVYEGNSNDPVLTQNYWSPKEYINIWIVDTYSPTYGANGINWATFPVMTNDKPLDGLSSISAYGSENYYPPYADGIVLSNHTILVDAAGSVITHEMGHYFGLFHVFDFGYCMDDYVQDTYHYNRNYYNSNAPNNLYRYTCQGQWQLGNNYMDYFSQNDYTFTAGQMERMRYAVSYSPVRRSIRFSDKDSHTSVKDTIGFYPEPIIQYEVKSLYNRQ